MSEKAFIVKKDSRIYNDYFEQKQERSKYYQLGKKFLKEHDIESTEFLSGDRFCVVLTKEEREKYKKQLLSGKNQYGMCCFRKNSKMQKAWEDEVMSHINLASTNKNNYWCTGFIIRGSYNMWDNDSIVYGYLNNKCDDEIRLSDDFTEIKMSEYYKALEDLQEMH